MVNQLNPGAGPGQLQFAGRLHRHSATALQPLHGAHLIHARHAGHCRLNGLALGLIGIYGVISYAVSQRTREIGIRLALGAQKGLMRWMFVRAALVLTAFGAGIGLCAAAALARLMKALLFGVSPLDPLTFAAVPIILALAAAVASFLPASRAAAVNPADALRAE